MVDSSLNFRVTSDVASATAGFKRLAASLIPVKRDADKASESLAKIGKTKVAPKADTGAIAKVKAEIARLQDDLRKQLEVDVNADTRKVQAKIRGLQSTLRTLTRKPPEITPTVNDKGVVAAFQRMRKARDSFYASLKQRTGITALSDIKESLSDVTGGLQRLGGGFADVFRNIGLPLLGSIGVAVAGIGTALGVTAVKAIGLADNMERAKLQMDSFTGNTTATVKLLRQVQAYADKTPFEFPELASASKRLLGVGIAAGKIPAQLAKIGDIAAQSGASVDDLALIFSQMVSSGRVNAEDMNQLADRGIAAWPKLAQAMHMSVAEVRDLSSKGKLGAKDVQLLWDTLSKGAKGSTTALADTLSGQISTLKDTVNGVLRDIGTALLPFAKTIVPQLTAGVKGIGTKVLGAMPKIIDMIAAGLSTLLDMPGAILRGLASLSQGFMFMVSDIQASLADLVGALAQTLEGIPGIGPEDVAGLRAAADSLRGAAVSSAAKGGTLFETLAAQAAKADTAVKPLKGKIEEARKVAQQGVVLAVSVQSANNDIAKFKGQLATLKKQKPTAEVRAKIDAAQRNLKRAQDQLKLLDKYQAHPEILAKDLASGKVKIVKGVLQTVPKSKNVDLKATDKTGGPTKSAKGNVKSVPSSHHTNLTAKDGVSGPVHNATSAINNMPTHKTFTLDYHVNYSTKGNPSGFSPSRVPGTNGVSASSTAVAAPQVQVYVRDEALAGLVDIRLNHRAARAARIIHRRDVLPI